MMRSDLWEIINNVLSTECAARAMDDTDDREATVDALVRAIAVHSSCLDDTTEDEGEFEVKDDIPGEMF